MSAIVKPLNLRLFMEGIEVPVIAAHVNAGPNSPATASIQIVPTDMGLHLLPRTFVMLFEYKPDLEGLSGRTTEPLHKELADYKVKFFGEVTSFSYDKTRTNRSLVLQCMDLSTYWDTCYQWFADYSKGGNAFTDRQQDFSGAGKSTYNSITGGHAQVMAGIVNSAPRSPQYKDVKGLLGGIIHLLESVGGIRYTSKQEPGLNGVNDFFTIAELRYNLLGMIGALTADTSSAKMFSKDAYGEWIQNGMSKLADMVSFRDMVNHLMQRIFHNVYPITSPYFIAEAYDGTMVETHTSVITDSATVGIPLFEMIKKIHATLLKAEGHGARAIFDKKEQDAQAGLEALSEANALFSQADILVDRLDTDDKSSVKTNFESARQILAEGNLNFNGDVSQTGGNIAQVAKDTAKSLADNLISASARVRGKKQVSAQGARGARMPTQLFLPDAFFVAPPRANVFFPDQYTRMSFSRNFMREVTRMQSISGTSVLISKETAKLLGSSYFAPRMRGTDGKVFATKGANSIRKLLPHEIHSGIIPRMEFITEIQRWSLKGSARLTKKGKYKKGKGIGFMQRLVNFQFFSHRWAARSLSISGPLNSNVVLGLPALVIDRSMPSKDVLERYNSMLGINWRPVQYLGRVVSVSDSITQDGGTTNVTMSHARTHRGLDDDFLGMLQRQPINDKFREEHMVLDTRNVLRALDRARDDAKSGIIRHAAYHATMIRRYLVSYFANPDIAPEAHGATLVSDTLRPGHRILSVEPSSNTIDLSEKDAASLGISSTDFAGFANGKEFIPCPATFGVTSDYTELATNKKTIAIEELMTPDWMGAIWASKNISKDVYKPLLGCKSITDGVVFKGPDLLKLFDSPTGDEDRVNAMPGSEQDSYEIPEGSIEEAVDSLVALYSTMKARGMDMGKFIQSYTDRPIANMEDLMGSPTIGYDDNGEVAALGSEDVVEGYFSRSYGNFNSGVTFPKKSTDVIQAGERALVGFFPGVAPGKLAETSDRVTISGTVGKTAKGKKGARATNGPITAAYDPRGRAWGRVRVYKAELELSRGLVG